MSDRCRLCTTNYLDRLAAEIAEQMWVCVAEGTMDNPHFDQAGRHWQITLKEYARASTDTAKADHG